MIVMCMGVDQQVNMARRALVTAALADGNSRLTTVLGLEALGELVAALRALGVAVRLDQGRACFDVAGCGGCWPNDMGDLYFASDLSAAHLIVAASCLAHGQYRIAIGAGAGDESVGPLVDALIDLGAAIGYAGDSGRFPVTIHATGLHGGTITLHKTAWPLTALLIVAPYCRADVFIEVPTKAAYPAEITETVAIMEAFGVQVIHDRAGRFIVPAPQRYRATEYTVS